MHTLAIHRTAFLATFCGLLCSSGAVIAEEAVDGLPLGAIARCGSPALRVHSAPQGYAFSASGTRLATIEPESRQVYIWDTASGRRVETLTFDSIVLGLVFLPIENQLVVVRDGTFVDSVELGTRKSLGSVKLSIGIVFASANPITSADGNLLALTNEGTGRVVVVDLHDRQQRVSEIEMPENCSVAAYAFSADNKNLELLVGNGRRASIDRATQKIVAEEKLPVDPFVSRAGQFDFMAGERFFRGISAAVFSRDATVAAYVSRRGFYCTALGPIKSLLHIAELPSLSGGMFCLASDGKTLAIVSAADHAIHVFDLSSQNAAKVLAAPFDPLTSCSLSANGRFLAAQTSSQLHVWDVNSGTEMSYSAGHDTVCDLAFAAGGKLLVSAEPGLCIAHAIPSGKEIWSSRGVSELAGLDPATSSVIVRRGERTIRRLDQASGIATGELILPPPNPEKVPDLDPVDLFFGEPPLHGCVKRALLAGNGRTLVCGYAEHCLGDFELSFDDRTAQESQWRNSDSTWDIVATNRQGNLALAVAGGASAAHSHGVLVDLGGTKAPGRFALPGGTVMGIGGSANLDRVCVLFAKSRGAQAGEDDLVAELDYELACWKSGAAKPDWSLPVSSWFGELPLEKLRVDFTPIAFSTDGKSLAIGGYDRAIHLLSAADGTELRKFSGDLPLMTAARFSAGDSLLASGGADGSIFVWDLNRQAP